MMETEAVVADTVRRRVNAEITGDRPLADRAVDWALSSYAGGASAAEAIEEARTLVRAWVIILPIGTVILQYPRRKVSWNPQVRSEGYLQVPSSDVPDHDGHRLLPVVTTASGSSG